MSVTLIVSVIAIVAAVAALINQFRPRPSTSTVDSARNTAAPASEAPAAAPASAVPSEDVSVSTNPVLPPILVDTSAIIDGRIADVAAAGFIPGRLVVPRFVLAELQNIADSEDAMRRGRGRRGLDVLNTLREQPDVDVEIIDEDVPKIREVDAKLVVLAQKFHCNVLTTDYNLNRVAQIQGVRVLNVNELSNAIRPVVLPGEELIVKVVQPGKERHQGVGYLADGTMIVVENGDKLIGQDVATEVTRVFQTVAGKMIFAVPRGSVQTLPPANTQATPTDNAAAPVHTERTRPATTPKPRNTQADIESRLIAATNNGPQIQAGQSDADLKNNDNNSGTNRNHRHQYSRRPNTKPAQSPNQTPAQNINRSV